MFHIRILTLPDTVSISGVTIRGGNTIFGGGGGAILNTGTLTLNSSIVSGNSSNGGGGIYNLVTMTITLSTIRNNAADDGAHGTELWAISDDGSVPLFGDGFEAGDGLEFGAVGKRGLERC